MTDLPDHRLLLVHAHPDDESIGQGATMAKYAAEGRGVTLVTCTAGEMGEIEREVIGENTLKAEDFISPGLPHCSSEGDRREVLCPVKDLAYETGDGNYRLSFFLPKGNYATCLMREFMKSEMTDY